MARYGYGHCVQACDQTSHRRTQVCAKNVNFIRSRQIDVEQESLEARRLHLQTHIAWDARQYLPYFCIYPTHSSATLVVYWLVPTSLSLLVTLVPIPTFGQSTPNRLVGNCLWPLPTFSATVTLQTLADADASATEVIVARIAVQHGFRLCTHPDCMLLPPPHSSRGACGMNGTLKQNKG